jgi:hypothetical protein
MGTDTKFGDTAWVRTHNLVTKQEKRNENCCALLQDAKKCHTAIDIAHHEFFI